MELNIYLFFSLSERISGTNVGDYFLGLSSSSRGRKWIFRRGIWNCFKVWIIYVILNILVYVFISKIL